MRLFGVVCFKLRIIFADVKTFIFSDLFILLRSVKRTRKCEKNYENYFLYFILRGKINGVIFGILVGKSW